MRTITLEEHMTTPEFVAALAKVDAPDAGAAMEGVRQKLLDVGDGRLQAMDAAGIDMQVLSLAGGGMDLLDAATATAVAHDVNDRLADAVRAHPDRFAAFATLALQEPDRAALEFERCVNQLHFKGVLVNGTTGGLFLDNPRFTPLFETAQQLDVPIYLHPAPPPRPVYESYFTGLPDPFGFVLSIAGWGWHTETGLHCLRLMVAGVLDRFPRLQIIIGHMGEDLPYSLARANAVLSGTRRLKRSISEYFHEHFHVTTSGYFTMPPFVCALMVVGADRLMFSIDYPYSTNAQGREFLDAIPVCPTDKEKISYGNAARLLKL